MPAKKTKNPKRWFTVAYLTREGFPCASHWRDNFGQRYCTKKILMEDLSHGMISFSRGAYAAAVWPGQITEGEALHGQTKPLFYIYEDGHIQKIS